MKWFELTIKLVEAFIWPAFAVYILYFFRQEIRQKIQGISKAKIGDLLELELEVIRTSDQALNLFQASQNTDRLNWEKLRAKLILPLEIGPLEEAVKYESTNQIEALRSAKANLENLVRNMAAHYGVAQPANVGDLSIAWLLARLREQETDLVPQIISISRLLANLDQVARVPDLSKETSDRLVVASLQVIRSWVEQNLKD